MARNLVVDKNILGWAERRKEQLSQSYKSIFRVGPGYELPQRSADGVVAMFCKEKDCDLITSDTKAYLHYFTVGIPGVRISKYGLDEDNDAPVLLIQIVD